MSADHHRHEPGHGHELGHGHEHGHGHKQEHGDKHELGHGHGHGHGPGHAHAVPSHGRVFAIGIGLNAAFVAVEAFYGWRVGSLALLADAGHNLGDVIGLVLAWLGAVAARLAPNARNTYGWKRASILAAFVNAVLLLAAMGWLAWEALQRLQTPAPLAGATVMVVAGIGIVVNGATALLFMRGAASDINLRGAFLHMAADALVSAGVVLAGGLVLAFGWAWVDPVTSLAIAAVIVVGTWRLLRQSLHLLFDGVPDSVDLEAVSALLAGLPGVARVHDLHVWAMGSAETALTAHLVMPQAPADDAFLADATRRLRERFGIGHVTIQSMREPFTASCAAPDGADRTTTRRPPCSDPTS